MGTPYAGNLPVRCDEGDRLSCLYSTVHLWLDKTLLLFFEIVFRMASISVKIRVVPNCIRVLCFYLAKFKNDTNKKESKKTLFSVLDILLNKDYFYQEV